MGARPWLKYRVVISIFGRAALGHSVSRGSQAVVDAMHQTEQSKAERKKKTSSATKQQLKKAAATIIS